MGIIKFVVCGWGVEFGKYYCGGAPARLVYSDQWTPILEPAVPLSYQYGFGLHWRTPHKEGEADNWMWWWGSRWFYGKNHLVVPQEWQAKIDALMKEWNQ